MTESNAIIKIKSGVLFSQVVEPVLGTLRIDLGRVNKGALSGGDNQNKIVFTCIPTLYHTTSSLRPDFSFETLISTSPTFLGRPFSSLVHENSIFRYIFRVSLKKRGIIPSFQETSSDLQFWSE